MLRRMQTLLALPVPVLAGAAMTVVGLALVLVAEHAERPRVLTVPSASRLGWLNPVFKPIASAGFLVAAFGHPAAFGSPANLAILIALILGALGDVLLIPSPRSAGVADGAAPPPPGPVFRLGVLSFLASHLGYIAAFILLGLSWGTVAIAAAPLALVGAAFRRYLAGHVGPQLKASVDAYIVVISLMVATAFGAAAVTSGPTWLPPTAALVFYASDLTVARQRFVVRRAWHRHVGLPLYYCAQFLFIGLLG